MINWSSVKLSPTQKWALKSREERFAALARARLVLGRDARVEDVARFLRVPVREIRALLWSEPLE